jgi:hypothetical protein
MKKELIVKGIYLLLILLFSYTAISKLADLDAYKLEMSRQVFSKPVSHMLIYTLPGIEILTAVLLITPRFRLTGFILSVLLLLIFTGYVILILSGFYNRVPCACGGVLSIMDWHSHLWFNIFFLVLSALGSVLQYQHKAEVRDIMSI